MESAFVGTKKDTVAAVSRAGSGCTSGIGNKSNLLIASKPPLAEDRTKKFDGKARW